jgi:hypothetical protein
VKTTNSYIKIKVVCLSANLREGANGHFYQYHKSLHGFLDKHFDVVYIGGEDSHQNQELNWFFPILPKSLSKPAPRISNSWMTSFINKSQSIWTGPSLFYIYEGSIYWLILALKIVQKKGSTVFLVNQFNSRKTVNRLTGKNRIIWLGLYKWIIQESKGRVLLAVDNQKYFTQLSQIFPEGFVKYIPIVPTLPLDVALKKNPLETVILIRGDYGKRILRSIVPQIMNSTQISVHGIEQKTLNKIGLTKATVSTGGLTYDDYKEKYSQYAKCVFLYDPSDFAYQSSGRFVDAHFAGIPILVPAVTAMAEEFPECSQIVRFDENDFDSVVDFICNPTPPVEHSCNVLSLGVRGGLESAISDSQLIINGYLEFSRLKQFFVFLLFNLMNLRSWLTRGGTLNIPALLDKLRAMKRMFR